MIYIYIYIHHTGVTLVRFSLPLLDGRMGGRMEEGGEGKKEE
jgi:hypothetical protein